MDFRKPKLLGDALGKVTGGGFDHTFCKCHKSTFCARYVFVLLEKPKGRAELNTTDFYEILPLLKDAIRKLYVFGQCWNIDLLIKDF